MTGIPSLDVVRRVIGSLEESGIEAAIGGSGLLAALGLTEEVRDWDVTTDGPVSTVEVALGRVGFPYRARACRGGGLRLGGALRRRWRIA